MVTNFKKNKRKAIVKNFFIHLIGISVIIISFFLVMANIKMNNKSQELNTQVENLRKQVREIKKINTDLKNGISQAQNGKYVEKIAREELDFQQKGEKTVSFVITKSIKEKQDNFKQKWISNWLSWLTQWFEK